MIFTFGLFCGVMVGAAAAALAWLWRRLWKSR